jgi:SAM-dependent methyltransferase
MLPATGGCEEDFWRQFDAADMMNDYAGYPADICSWMRCIMPRGATLADVGCGSGRYARALAPWCSRIYAIDPSPAQIRRAKSSVCPPYSDRLRFIESTWEDAKIPRVDFTLAAYSFLVEDITPFLRKLLERAVHGAFLVFRAGPPESVRPPPFNAAPSCDYVVLESLLAEGGHRPDVAFFARSYAVPYELFSRSYAWYLPASFDLRDALATAGRLVEREGGDHVLCRRTDACIYVPTGW